LAQLLFSPLKCKTRLLNSGVTVILSNINKKVCFMANDVSKLVATCLATTREVVSSIELHGPIVAGPLKTELQKFSPVEINVDSIFSSLSSYFNGVARNLQDADIALAQEVADDPKCRENRDNGSSQLNKTIGRIKSILPEETLVSLGLGGTIPTVPDALINYGRKIAGLISENPGVFETPETNGIVVKIDATSTLDNLNKGINNLVTALDDVKREEREYQAALEHRDAKLQDWRNAYVATASVLAGFYQLAGRTDLADRIRPTIRKASSSAVVEEQQPQKVN
jgi:hypothetical protein